MLRPSLSALAVFALLAGAAACTKKNDDFCCTTVDACQRHGGDGELRPCDPDSDRPYCDNNGEHGSGRTCIAPPGEPCSPEGECDDPDTPICLEGLCVECGGPADCPYSDPVCSEIDHQCGSCGDQSECSGFAGRPFCDEGACVGCRTGSDCELESAPICDDADRTCRGCVSSAECASEVCDWIGGGCVAEDDVLYVAEDGTGSLCTRDDPCGSVMTAVGEATVQRNWIKMAAGDYLENVELDGDTIRIVGEGANLRSEIDSPVFDVRGGADLRVSGLRIHDADGNGDGPGDGVYCTNSGGTSTVVLDRVVVESNDDQGVDANSCRLTVTRSTLRDNRRGGLSLDSVDFEVVNNFIVANGSGGTVSAGVLVDKNPPTAGRLEHNTIAANINPAGSPSGLQCVLVGNPIGFRNNIIYGNQGSATQVEGSNCVHTFSLIGPNGVSGEGNTMDAPTFASETDFHLMAGSSGIDAAEQSDVPDDWDGQPRPGGDTNDMGADEVVR